MFYIAIREIAYGSVVDMILIAGLSILIVGVGLSVISCVNYSVNNWSGITGKEKPKKTE